MRAAGANGATARCAGKQDCVLPRTFATSDYGGAVSASSFARGLTGEPPR